MTERKRCRLCSL